MTAVTTGRRSVWWPVDVDPEQVAADVKRWFPGVSAWLGEYTGKWWAVVGDRLLEADNPNELHQRIAVALQSTSRPAQPVGQAERTPIPRGSRR